MNNTNSITIWRISMKRGFMEVKDGIFHWTILSMHWLWYFSVLVWLWLQLDMQQFTGIKDEKMKSIFWTSHFSFRRNQDKTVRGLSSDCRKRRKHRNLVTMKFNMFNWLLETLSTFLVLIFINRILTIFYIVTLSCGTPIVYFLGIEENRSMVKQYVKSNISTFSKKEKE